MSNAIDLFRASSIMFIATDPIGLTAVYLALTHNLALKEKKTAAFHSSITAFVAGIAFLFTGQPLFNLLGIQMGDFKIGGGLLLVTISIYDILNPGKRKVPQAGSAIVPLGVPLITGPAVLTTLILLNDNYGYFITVISFLINIGFVFIAFYYSKWVLKLFGSEGIRGFGKLISILLSAYGVMMIRMGILQAFRFNG